MVMSEIYHYEDEELDHSAFFGGLSREPQFGGVNQMAAVCNGISFIILFISTSNFIWWLVGPFVHLILRALNAKDPNIFANIFLQVITTMTIKNAREFHNTPSLSPINPNRFDY